MACRSTCRTSRVWAVRPARAREIGLIEVSAEYGGGGSPSGLRDSEADFYPTLASIAGQMSGTGFTVTRKKEQRFGVQWIETLTAVRGRPRDVGRVTRAD